MAVDIDTIMKLPAWQKGLIFIGIIILLTGLNWQFYYKDRKETLNTKKDEIVQLHQKLEKMKALKPKLANLRETIKKLEIKLSMLQERLPKTSEIPKLLTSITRIGRESGLEFKLFKPQSEKRKGFYSEIPVGINIVGGYHDVAVFCDRIGKLPRIVNISDIRMRGLKEVSGSINVNVQCTATTFKFVESKGKGKSKGKKRKK
ncbi:MAG: type 4a pilus biogenesis protein PilO [Thermodesulfobacteriota bacterium]|nr:type 4a pilus biogenesis protein PilO [Thermodesulfobacteriota bacterium]